MPIYMFRLKIERKKCIKINTDIFATMLTIAHSKIQQTHQHKLHICNQYSLEYQNGLRIKMGGMICINISITSYLLVCIGHDLA